MWFLLVFGFRVPQIGFFASEKAEVAEFLKDNQKTMSHFFLPKNDELFTVTDVHSTLENLMKGVSLLKGSMVRQRAFGQLVSSIVWMQTPWSRQNL